jgi:hypothetical protein
MRKGIKRLKIGKSVYYLVSAKKLRHLKGKKHHRRHRRY